MKTKYDIYGALYFNPAGKLVDRNGKVIQLRGFSTHNLTMYPEYVNRPFFEFMRDKWHVDVIRLTLHPSTENNCGTIDENNKKAFFQLIDKGIKAATELGLYVIIDLHLFNTSNPLLHMDDTIAFFRKLAKRYHAYGNVIYEICNEANADYSWEDIKKYAQTILPVIREYDRYAIVLVGTPNKSLDMDTIYANPVTGYSNVGYVFHFDADSHPDKLCNKLTEAINQKLPLFVSSFSPCTSSVGEECNEEQRNLWLDLMDEHQISYCMWNLSNNHEPGATFLSICEKTTDFSDEDLTSSARWYVKELAKRNVVKKE